MVSFAKDKAAIEGNLRIYLPEKMATVEVAISLIESKTNSKPALIISKQFCFLGSGESCGLDLPYIIDNIKLKKQYRVDILVVPKIELIEQSYNSSFPVLTFNNPKILNLIISIPPKPTE